MLVGGLVDNRSFVALGGVNVEVMVVSVIIGVVAFLSPSVSRRCMDGSVANRHLESI